MELAGARSDLRISGAGQLPGNANYFIGSDSAQWHRNVPTYARVKYSGVYPGVDLIYYGNQRQLEYDFALASGANPKSIQFKFPDSKKLLLTADGDLTVSAAHGQITLHKPVAYQQRNGLRQSIPSRFTLQADHIVGFSLGSYDRSKPLIIDPVLVYSSYLGGNILDAANAIAVDKSGNAYLAGSTYSFDFPVTKEAFQSTNRNTNSDLSVTFVAKLNPSGTALLYSTYLGSGACSKIPLFENGLPPFPQNGLAVNELGNAYVTGSACSTAGFPVTRGGFQTTNPSGARAFVTKLDATGSELIYSTYLGGSGGTCTGETGNALALDGSGNAFITGLTGSSDFPVTKGAFQTTNRAAANNNCMTAFVTKLNPTGSALVYSTYLGGSGSEGVGDVANAVALDGSGNTYIAGLTYSDDFPVTERAFQRENRAFTTERVGSNAFVTKIDAKGTALVYSTYLGGSGGGVDDAANALAVDDAGSAYVAGSAGSADFPVTAGAFQTKNRAANQGQYPGNNAFVTKLEPNGTALVYSTFLGGSGVGPGTDGAGGDAANALAIDSLGDAYVGGITESIDFPVTRGAFETTRRGSKQGVSGFVTELDPFGAALAYSSYLGGSTGYEDYVNALAVECPGNVYVAGLADSVDFPITEGAFQGRNHGNANAFVAKLTLDGSAMATRTTLVSSANPQISGHPVTFTATVTGRSGSTIPSGRVEFLVDGKYVLSARLNAEGKGTYTTSALAVGKHIVEATYSVVTSDFGPSSTSQTETIATSR
jgi:hypothetical protein